MNYIIVTFFILFASCSTIKIKPVGDEALSEIKGLISLDATNLKIKSKYFAGRFLIINQTSNSKKKKKLLVYLRDIKCFRGEQAGRVKNNIPFNIGEKYIDIDPSQQKALHLKCLFPFSVDEGELKIVIEKVYDNPSMDGLTSGKTLAKDFTWSFNI
jgi:hypothetical protein